MLRAQRRALLLPRPQRRRARRRAREWLLFMDADCAPAPELLEPTSIRAPCDREGLLAGTIVDAPRARLAARPLRVLAQLLPWRAGASGQRPRLRADRQPAGSPRGVRGGRRLRRGHPVGGRRRPVLAYAGRGMAAERRPPAPSSPTAIARTCAPSSACWRATAPARAGSTTAIQGPRRAGRCRRELARSGFDAVRHTASGDGDEAAFRLVDALGLVAHNVGYHGANEIS